MNNLQDKIKGALYGVAIGDALGAPLEFMNANSINAKHGLVTEMIGGGWLNVKPGEITDDTQMTIAVAKGIIAHPDDPVPAVGMHFIQWYNSMPKDIGNTCANSIQRAMLYAQSKDEVPPSKYTWMAASEQVDKEMRGRTAGNGALMRTIYPALYYELGKESKDMMQATIDIARMTHWSEESTNLCIRYVQEICLMIYNGYNGPVGYSDGEEHEPSGYVIDSYAVASNAINQTDNFEDAIVAAVNQGGDADTIGAIAGGIAGAKYGYSNIPKRWIDALEPEVKKELDYLADKAMKRKGNRPWHTSSLKC